MSSNIASSDQDSHVAAKSVDYVSILTEAILNTERNSAQLRALIYERARFHLKREILFGNSSLGLAELVRHINALELAIARIETNAVDRPQIQTHEQRAPQYQEPMPGDHVAPESTAASETIASYFGDDTATLKNTATPESATTFESVATSGDTERDAASESAIPTGKAIAPRRGTVEIMPAIPIATSYGLEPIPLADYIGNNQGWDTINRFVRTATRVNTFILIGFLFIGLVLTGGALWYFPQNSGRLRGPAANTFTDRFLSANTREGAEENALKQALVSALKDAGAVETKPKVSYPLPTSFGIYALHNNKLTGLETIPISVPDPRVALSAEIKKPSTLEISDSKPEFILFRRDLLNNAPQKITVRVIARMMRETKVINGKPIVTEIEDTWRIRNISRELSVAPIPGQPEMVIARLDGDTALAAGRYALVFNRIGYDFTIKGPVQSLDFCLEGFETLDGTVFNQCRKP